MKMKHVVCAVALSPLFFSCKKENTSTETTPSSFSYQLRVANASSAVNRTATIGRSESASIQWTSGSANANQLKFEAKNAGGEIEFKQNIQQQIDLFAATSALGNITIPAGNYSEVEFKAMLTPSGNAKALVLNGNFTSGGVNTPVSFQVNSSVELKAEKANVSVAAGSTYSALNALDLSQLTKNISEANLANATRTNGTIVISDNSNKSLYSTMLANLSAHHGEAEVEHH